MSAELFRFTKPLKVIYLFIAAALSSWQTYGKTVYDCHFIAVAAENGPIAEEQFAKIAGLIYQNDSIPGISRKRQGNALVYFFPDGSEVKDDKSLERIANIALPPIYRNVWIAPDPLFHLQATGIDVQGRKQYYYHPSWTELRNTYKFHRMIGFGRILPIIRQITDKDLAVSGLPKEKILALIVQLLDKTAIRIGNDEGVNEHQSFGLTTLLKRHVKIDGDTIHMFFQGKSGVEQNVKVKDRRIAKIIVELKKFRGETLFKYEQDDGNLGEISSDMVNEYLKNISRGLFTAKDFRTFVATTTAVKTLLQTKTSSSTEAVRAAEKEALLACSKKLGNTPAVCREHYIFPGIFSAFKDGSLDSMAKKATKNQIDGLNLEENIVLLILRRDFGLLQ